MWAPAPSQYHPRELQGPDSLGFLWGDSTQTQSGSASNQQLGLVLAQGFQTRPALDPYCENVNAPDLEDQLYPVSGQRPAKCCVSLAGIPTLIVLDPQGEVITRQGRVEVLNDEDCREFPWHPKPVLELSDSNAVQLNEGPCLVLFVGMELRGKWKTGQNGPLVGGR